MIPKKIKLRHDIDLFKKGILLKIRNPKLKCPICKKKTNFKQFDLNHYAGNGFIDGNYARAYCCEKCGILIAKKEEDLK